MRNVYQWRRVACGLAILSAAFWFIEKYTGLNFIPLIEDLSWQQAGLIFTVITFLLIPTMFDRQANSKDDT